MSYFDNRDILKSKAILHIAEMEKNYANEIKDSINNTKIINSVYIDEENAKLNNTYSVEDSDSVTSLYKHKDEGKVAVLNFASYKNPGGMFINGSSAQEECLCHASSLYNVLSQFENSYYAWNRAHKNNALYLNRCLYSPNIIFNYNNEDFMADVITVAAPNFTAARRFVYHVDNLKALASRINFVIDIAKSNHVDTLIAGAFGCGIFGQNPIEVATMFKARLNKLTNYPINVIFAIPGDRNLNAFKQYLGRRDM